MGVGQHHVEATERPILDGLTFSFAGLEKSTSLPVAKSGLRREGMNSHHPRLPRFFRSDEVDVAKPFAHALGHQRAHHVDGVHRAKVASHPELSAM